MPTTLLHLPVRPPFELRLALFGHGWIDLAPHEWHEAAAAFSTVLDTGDAVLDLRITQPAAGRLQLRIDARQRPDDAQLAGVRVAVARMLRLDDDLSALWQMCTRHPRLRWVADRGAGRLMRSPSLFEDLLKLLLTTNCSWAATRGMVQRLVAALGAIAPSGARAFPTPAACAEPGERFWRDIVRAGYRAKSCAALARAFAGGALDEAALAASAPDALRRRLLALPGFGPYAAGQAMRLLGHYEDLALDSWCRARFAELRGKRRPPSDRTIAREYAAFGRFGGLVLWLDLTADWHHGEQPSILRGAPPAEP
jgi:N-glycosylase/DNA lyase